MRIQASVQLEFPIDTAPLVGADQAVVRVADRMQRTIEACLPEIQEPAHFGKIGGEIVLLPDVALQDRRVIRQVVEDLGGRQTIALQLFFHVLVHRVHFFSFPLARLLALHDMETCEWLTEALQILHKRTIYF